MIPGPRWWFRLFALWAAVAFGLIGAGALFGPERWFSAPSLDTVHDLVPIPWRIYGAAFLLAAVGIGHHRTRLPAYVVGFLLAWWFAALQLYFTVFGGEVINIFGTGLVLLSPLVPLAGVRYAQQEH